MVSSRSILKINVRFIMATRKAAADQNIAAIFKQGPHIAAPWKVAGCSKLWRHSHQHSLISRRRIVGVAFHRCARDNEVFAVLKWVHVGLKKACEA
jgi:hypothetical protein